MNWPIKIFFLYAGFVAMMATLVTIAVQQDFALVTPNYYAEELVYEQRIQQIRNAKALAEPLKVEQQATEIRLQFPLDEGPTSGKIHLYKPDNARLDQWISLQPDPQGLQILPTSGLNRGRWLLQVHWQQGELPYYHEESLFIP